MDKNRKKTIKQTLIWVGMILLVALLAVLPAIAGNGAEADGPVATVKYGTAETGTITTMLGGGGTLAEETPQELTLPEGVKIQEYLVTNGDYVHAGDPLAAVDRVSLMGVIAEVQATMDYISQEMEDAESSEGANKIQSQTAGRVKVVYAQPGDDVQDVMRQHGALAVLSLDGRMAVDIQRHTDLAAGDTVQVVFRDETTADGRVESALGDSLTVSIADKGYALGEQVLVRTGDGEILGSGELYIQNAWRATAYYGTVSRVNVKENDTVSQGKVLMQLENTAHSTQVQLLNAQRQEYEELMEKLFRIYDTGCLEAPCDGYVQGIEENSPWLLAAQTGDWQAEFLSQEEPGWRVMLLSNTETPPAGEGTEGETPGQTPPEGEEAPKTYTVISAVQVDGQISENLWVVRRKAVQATVTDLSILSVDIPLTAMPEQLALAGVRTADGQPHEVKIGDILLYVQEGESAYWVYQSNAFSGMAGNFGNLGSFANFGSFFSRGAQEETFEKFDLTETEVLSVVPVNTMTLDITVDELDIGRIRLGQEMTVTVHALPDCAVTAHVTEIGKATNSGGNSKFTVRLQLHRQENMLGGMSASAAMPLDTVENVLCVPAAALYQQGGTTYVYTAWDEKTELPTGPVAVQTGLSDGEFVQILSGLSEGDSVCYLYYDAQDTDNS